MFVIEQLVISSIDGEQLLKRTQTIFSSKITLESQLWVLIQKEKIYERLEEICSCSLATSSTALLSSST